MQNKRAETFLFNHHRNGFQQAFYYIYLIRSLKLSHCYVSNGKRRLRGFSGIFFIVKPKYLNSVHHHAHRVIILYLRRIILFDYVRITIFTYFNTHGIILLINLFQNTTRGRKQTHIYTDKSTETFMSIINNSEPLLITLTLC